MSFTVDSAYLEALRATGVETRLGQFKRRQRTCPFCGRRFVTFEEKETDVAIGATMTRLVCDDACDTVVLVTGDTDLVPAFRLREIGTRARRWRWCSPTGGRTPSSRRSRTSH